MSFNGVSATLTSPSGHGRFGARPRLMSELMAIGYRRQGCAAAVDREGSSLSVLCPALSNVGQNGHLAQMIVLNRSFAVPSLALPFPPELIDKQLFPLLGVPGTHTRLPAAIDSPCL